MFKVIIDHDKCTLCGDCTEYVRCHSLTIWNKLEWNEENCQRCESCKAICDEEAIRCEWL